MKNILLLFIFLNSIGSHILQGQTYEQQKVQLQFFNHYGKVPQKGPNGGSMIGSEFVYDDWKPMDIAFKDTIVHFEHVKLNLQTSYLEVLYKGEEKVIASQDFRYVSVTEGGSQKTFLPAGKLAYNDVWLEGFAEVIGNKEEKVLVQHHIAIKPPNPQANIVGGHTENKRIKVTSNYIYDGIKLTLIKKKKDLQEYYSRRSKILNQYLKDNKPNIKDPRQLNTIVEHMSQKKSNLRT